MHLLMCNRFNPHEGYTTVALPHHTRPNSTAPIDATPYRATMPYHATPRLAGHGVALPSLTSPRQALPDLATMPYLA